MWDMRAAQLVREIEHEDDCVVQSVGPGLLVGEFDPLTIEQQQLTPILRAKSIVCGS